MPRQIERTPASVCDGNRSRVNNCSDMRFICSENRTNSQPHPKTLLDGAFYEMIEKRCDEREEANESAFMELLNPVATERVPLNILNRSKRGMCVGSSVFLPCGAEVRVFVGNIQFFGNIRYCI